MQIPVPLVMTFGSFIGFVPSFPLVIFGFQHLMVDGVMTHNIANPNGPALMYAWMGLSVP